MTLFYKKITIKLLNGDAREFSLADLGNNFATLSDLMVLICHLFTVQLNATLLDATHRFRSTRNQASLLK